MLRNYAINSLEKNSMANEFAPIFQSKTPVVHKNVSIDNIIKGVKEFNPETPRVVRRVNHESNSTVSKAGIMISNYKKGLERKNSSQKVSIDFIGTKKPILMNATSPRDSAKHLIYSQYDNQKTPRQNVSQFTASKLGSEIMQQCPLTSEEKVKLLVSRLRGEKK
jgi:hypothetical protein